MKDPRLSPSQHLMAPQPEDGKINLMSVEPYCWGWRRTKATSIDRSMNWPTIHSAFVHFPIAFVVLSVIVDLIVRASANERLRTIGY